MASAPLSAPTKAQCQRCARSVPWVSFWGNFALGVYKLFVGVVGVVAEVFAPVGGV